MMQWMINGWKRDFSGLQRDIIAAWAGIQVIVAFALLGGLLLLAVGSLIAAAGWILQQIS